jgi:N-acetylmuramic acid 6-phosphate etherase
MITEQSNPNTRNLDQMSTLDVLRAINDEDQQVALAVRQALPSIAQAVDAIHARLAQGGRLIYSGAGTSGRLGILDAAECPPTYGTPPELVQGIIAGGDEAIVHSIENVEDSVESGADDLRARHLTAQDAVVGVAASGRTPYVLGALAYARQVGALTVGFACNVPAPILEAAEIAIGVPVGAEVVSGSTRMKAGTAQKLVLNMISTAVMIKLGKVYGNLMVDVQITNEKLANRARGIVQQLTKVDENRAAELLDAAGGSASVAVAMHFRGVDAAAARLLLQQAGGLRGVIGDVL